MNESQESPLICLVFDLDLTLGNVWSMFSSVEDAHELNIYSKFVDLCAHLETQGRLGALRPGILPFFKRVAEKQQAGRFAKCVIYSNNSSVHMLEFARDLIHKAIGADVFCSCVHWEHELRKHEIVPGQPGNGKKTWETIKTIYQTELGIIPSPERTLFYDDQQHPDLMNILKENYILVKPYEYKVPMTRQNLILTSAHSGTPLPPTLGIRNNWIRDSRKSPESYSLDTTLDRFQVQEGGLRTPKRRILTRKQFKYSKIKQCKTKRKQSKQ